MPGSPIAAASQTDISVIRRVMEVDYFGAVMLTKAVLPSMLERGSGRIACISSVAGKYGSPMRSGYCGAKHAMHGFFDSLREEVRDSGIGVTIAVPGAIRTDVSINALTGDGSRYGRMDPFLENGMPPEVCAAKILDAIDAGTPEALIAEGVARRNVVLKRWAPWLLSRTMRRENADGATLTGCRRAAPLAGLSHRKTATRGYGDIGVLRRRRKPRRTQGYQKGP